jgi:MFS family permease
VSRTPDDDGAKAAAGTAAAGQALAPAIGGGLTQALGWRALFWVNVPLCFVAFVLVWRTTLESRDETAERSIDYPGLVTIAGGSSP